MSKERTGIIYIATNKINGKSYIGQTVQTLKNRINDHNKQINNKRPNSPFTNAIGKYGKDSFIWAILHDKVSIEKLDDLERLEIKKHNSLVKNGRGYNLESGGNKNKKLSEQTKRKISKSLTGKKRSKEVIEKIRTSHLGQVPWNKGKKMKKDDIEKMIERRSKMWKIFKPDGSFEIVKNLTKYCVENNLSQGSMHNTSTGRLKQYKGYMVKKIEGEE